MNNPVQGAADGAHERNLLFARVAAASSAIRARVRVVVKMLLAKPHTDGAVEFFRERIEFLGSRNDCERHRRQQPRQGGNDAFDIPVASGQVFGAIQVLLKEHGRIVLCWIGKQVWVGTREPLGLPLTQRGPAPGAIGTVVRRATQSGRLMQRACDGFDEFGFGFLARHGIR